MQSEGARRGDFQFLWGAEPERLGFVGFLAEGGQATWALEWVFGAMRGGRLEDTVDLPVSPLVKSVKVSLMVPVASGSYQIPRTAG